MSSRVTLSSDERASLLREARSADGGARVPVRTSSGSPKKPSLGFGKGFIGGGGVRPPGGSGGRGRGGRRRRGVRTTILLVLTLLILLGGLLSAKVLDVGRNVLNPERSIFAQLTDLLFRGERALAGEDDDRINVLLIAIGGKGHKGENLADTIMLASFRPKEKEVALLSIPRDLYVKIPETSVFTKINAVHAYRENEKRGEGPIILKQKVEEITGVPIHYYARVDFTAFKQVVDEIGGVEIVIPNSFFDYWHQISFPAGTEHMNGERALAYARARYVEGPEGGDFKRAERQQQLLLAIRNKVFSANTAFDLRAVTGILDALGDNVVTNFHLWELKRLFELTREIPKDHIRSAVLSTGPNGLLVGGTEILDGKPASVLHPRAGIEKYDDIHRFVENIFAEAKITPSPEVATVPASPTPAASPTATPSPSPDISVADEKPTMEVRNGTTVSGLAARVSKALEKEGFKTLTIGNASDRGREETIVVDLSGGKKPESLKVLLATLGVGTAVSIPESETPTKADFLVLLGTDAADKFK